MVVEGLSGDWCLGKANVAEEGAGRWNSARWEVFVRGMVCLCVFCRSPCGASRRVVLGDETIVSGLLKDSGLRRSHGVEGSLYA